jgi:hypothetical protein
MKMVSVSIYFMQALIFRRSDPINMVSIWLLLLVVLKLSTCAATVQSRLLSLKLVDIVTKYEDGTTSLLLQSLFYCDHNDELEK